MVAVGAQAGNERFNVFLDLLVAVLLAKGGTADWDSEDYNAAIDRDVGHSEIKSQTVGKRMG